RPAWLWALGVLALLALLAWLLHHPGAGKVPNESDEPPAKPRGVYVQRPAGPGFAPARAAA
ncbi:MAG TPA: hypothetical protein VF646_13050, partial [Cytophagales bacterium]